MYTKLTALAPEQVFLLQGQKSFFNALIQNISEKVPNLEYVELSRFAKDDAQSLVSFNLERNPGSWCLVYFDVFMTDAAQILLKTLEEPNEGIYIVLVTPHPYLVPQTIRSRVRLILGNTEMEIPDYLSSKKVLLEYVKEVFGKESEEDASTRRAQATVLLDNIEHKVKDDPEKLKAVYEAKDMLFKANMPTKQVMEYLVAMIF